MRQQKGYLFHSGRSWFLRYCDNVLQTDGTIKRKLVCKKLDVEYGGKYRSKASVKEFAQEKLKPVNSGLLDVRSTSPIVEFVDKVYFPEFVNRQLRASTQKGYRDTWENHLKPRMGKLTLREFRTVNGEKMLADIARQSAPGRNTLKHIKSFLSGVFKQAKRLGILDGINPMQDTSIPHASEPEETYAYGLSEIKAMIAMLTEPARTVVLTAAFSGLRKSEIRGLRWADFDGKELTVRRSVWNKMTSEPKTRKSRAPVPVVWQLADALNAHKVRAGILAQPDLPIFQAGNGQPINLDNLARRVVAPVSSWHGWHAFRRGLATNLHALGVDDKTIQAILRHSNVSITQNIYIKSVSESQVAAMDSLSEKFKTCTVLATDAKGPVN